MGIAMRMAALMQLHREETYQVQSTSPDLIIRAESARRTLVSEQTPAGIRQGPLSLLTPLAAVDAT